MCFTETLLTKNLDNAALFLAKFDIHRSDRPSKNGNTKHGGVLIGVKKNIAHTRIMFDSPDCVITILHFKIPLLLCCMYSAHTYCWSANKLMILLNHIRYVQQENSVRNVILLGDINFALTDWSTLTSRAENEQVLLDALCSFNYEQAIKIDHRKHLMDVILCNNGIFFLMFALITF